MPALLQCGRVFITQEPKLELPLLIRCRWWWSYGAIYGLCAGIAIEAITRSGFFGTDSVSPVSGIAVSIVVTLVGSKNASELKKPFRCGSPYASAESWRQTIDNGLRQRITQEHKLQLHKYVLNRALEYPNLAHVRQRARECRPTPIGRVRWGAFLNEIEDDKWNDSVQKVMASYFCEHGKNWFDFAFPARPGSVPGEGFEPSRVASADFESAASAISPPRRVNESRL
jgi:hypothetical protein